MQVAQQKNQTHQGADVIELEKARFRKVWILRLGDVSWLTPSRIVILFSALLAPISYFAEMPLVTPLILAYALGITNYLIGKQIQELEILRVVITSDAPMFPDIVYSLTHHNRFLLMLAWPLGPLIMFAINFNGPQVMHLRSGAPIDLAIFWGLLIAASFWTIMFQMVVVFLTNALTMWNLADKHTAINLLEVNTLTPYARIGMRSILIFVGGYSLIPIALADSMDYLQPVLISLFGTLPIAIALLIMPMDPIRRRLIIAKEAELLRVQAAIHGDRTALSDSPIAADANSITLSNLVLYREMIEKISVWPINFPIFVRFVVYIIIPPLAWAASAFVAKQVDAFF